MKVSPSILSADFTRLGDEISSVKSAEYLHFDVMDGDFVPNISVGVPVLQSVRKYTDMILDVHLMISKPLRMIPSFAKAGADIIVFHVEADTEESIFRSLETVRELGKKAGLAIKPKTPASSLEPYIDMLDLALVMTVEPGFGGQSFMADQMPKVAALRRMIDEINPGCELEVDGGIDEHTAREAKAAGANVLVAGSAVFKHRDRAEIIRAIREA
jgi:ribulose-phosphate 3-epimerase